MTEVNFELQELAAANVEAAVEVQYELYMEEMYQRYCAAQDEYDSCYDEY